MSSVKSDIEHEVFFSPGLDKNRYLIKLNMEVYRKQLAEISPSVPAKSGRLPFFYDRLYCIGNKNLTMSETSNENIQENNYY